jgi:chemotaxis protein methyltransferase CheR
MPAGCELCESARQAVRFLRQDIRREMPDGPFDLILCRNLAFTYFDEAGQRDLLAKIAARLRAGGFLIVGIGETIPDAARHSFTSMDPAGVYSLQPDRGQNRHCGWCSTREGR